MYKKIYYILFFIFLYAFASSSCENNKNQAIKKENEMLDLKILHNKLFIYTLKAKHIKNELFWTLDMRQNIYFGTPFEQYSDFGKNVKTVAIQLEEQIGKYKNNSFLVKFLDEDNFVISETTFKSKELRKNEENQWGYNYRKVEDLTSEKISRIASVQIEISYDPQFEETIKPTIEFMRKRSEEVNRRGTEILLESEIITESDKYLLEYQKIRNEATNSSSPKQSWE
jgi:hypothetical protein